MEDIKQIIAKNIAALRQASGMTQLELEVRREEATVRMLEDRSRFSYLCTPDIEIDLPTGAFKFDEDRNPIKACAIIQYQGTDRVYISSIEP